MMTFHSIILFQSYQHQMKNWVNPTRKSTIKCITAQMMGFKAFHSATATLAGIETAHMIRKGQFGANGHTAFQQFAALAA
jgi:transposase-like protein